MLVVPQPLVDAMPEPPVSVGAGHVTVTLPVYQPFRPAVPETLAAPTVGPVLSMRTVRVDEVKPLPTLSTVTTRRS